MTRGQWVLVSLVGVVALIAFNRTEIIAQRIGMAPMLRQRGASGGIA